ncbi:MAG: TolC family protein [Deltaproteobacteria bacterium]|nr:TolC family protein [Deltaproteobacteria bacterium]
MHRSLALSALLLLGCATSPYDRAWLARELSSQTGHAPRAEADAASTAPRLPPRVSLGDGLTEEEAAAIALWNNPTFQSDLAKLGFARGDLADAGLLPNPTLSLLFPLGPRQLEAWLAWPIDALWQRPRRVEAARLDVERVARGLVQSGLDVARDARVAHAEVVLAVARARLRAETASATRAIAELTAVRLRTGDVGDPEAAATRVEAGAAMEQAARAGADAAVARARLRQLLGLMDLPDDLAMVTPADETSEPQGATALVATALAARPDVRAAELALEAAGARAGWERSRVFAVALRADGFAPSASANVTEYAGRIGPQLTLPIFNQNQGGVGRAEAEAERAAWRIVAVRQQVITEVTAARAQLAQARAALGPWRADVLPAAEEVVRGATQAFAQGEVSYLVVLDATRRLLDARLREAELLADVRRAAAQLDRSTGGRRATR